MMIAVIDYGAGNIKSVLNALAAAVPGGAGSIRTVVSPSELLEADAAVLPGVGEFGDAARSLRRTGLDRAVTEYIRSGRPFLGICVGLQLLFEYSEESPGERGLGIFGGGISRLPAGRKIPHMGWNDLEFTGEAGLIDSRPGQYFYFVHSYYLSAEDRAATVARCDYGGLKIDAMVRRGNLFATQFHPEKSGGAGIGMLRSFALLAKL